MTAVAALLAAAGLVTAGAPARAQSLPDDCEWVEYDSAVYLECVTLVSGTITFDDLAPGLPPDEGSPVILTARGGNGADLPSTQGRSAGPGGGARTVASADDIDQLYVAMGQNADVDSRLGGSSTVVSEVPIGEVTGIDDVYLIAGGGGAQGARLSCLGGAAGAGSGGRGGHADAARTDGAAAGAAYDGGSGQTAGCNGSQTGRHGTGGDRGVAGINTGDPRSNGIDGIGGHGGDNGWQGNIAHDHEPGRGGVTSVYAMGGGGWGGGGGGERNGGAGGGGSYARAATEALDLDEFTTYFFAWPAFLKVAWLTDAPTISEPEPTESPGPTDSPEATESPDPSASPEGREPNDPTESTEPTEPIEPTATIDSDGDVVVSRRTVTVTG